MGQIVKKTAADYREKVRDLKISHARFGRICRVDPRTERRWSSGEADVPGPAEALLDLLRERPELLHLLPE